MNESVLTEKCRTMYRHMISKNTDELSKLLDDSFVLVHMTGMRQSKSAFLQAIETGVLNYYSEELESAEAKKTKSGYTFIGQSRVNAAVFGGGRHTWRLQLTIDFKESNGEWLMTRAVASTY